MTSAAARANAPHPQIYATGTGAAEPTLGINRKGDVFYVGVDYDPNAPRLDFPVMRTTDSGRTWKDVSPMLGPRRRHAIGLDPMLHVDPDTGRVFTADIQTVVGCSAMVSFSDDNGKSWTTSEICGLTDHQNLFTGKPRGSQTIGYPNLVYYCAIDGGLLAAFGTMTGCVKSLDGGITWIKTGAPAFINDPSQEGGNLGIKGHCGGATGHGFADTKGIIYLPRGWCGQPWLAISDDEGRSWNRVQVANNGMPYDPVSGLEEHEAAVAVDKDGVIYYSWTARNRLPYLAVSRNRGKSWSKPMMIGPPGITEASLPTMDVGADGRIAIAYIGSTNAPGGKSPDGAGKEYKKATWNAYVTTTTEATGADPLFYTTSVNDPKDPIVRGDCGIVRCQQVYDFIDVDIAPDGTPWVALVDGCPPNGKCYPATLGGIGIVGRVVGGRSLR